MLLLYCQSCSEVGTITIFNSMSKLQYLHAVVHIYYQIKTQTNIRSDRILGFQAEISQRGPTLPLPLLFFSLPLPLVLVLFRIPRVASTSTLPLLEK
jgi:hypothetical protein